MPDSGKRKISLRETGLNCFPGNGIHPNSGAGCGIFLPVCCENAKSNRRAFTGVSKYESKLLSVMIILNLTIMVKQDHTIHLNPLIETSIS